MLTDESPDTIGVTHNHKPQWSQIFHRPLFLSDTSSEQSFHTLKKWLRECLQSHDTCGKGDITRLPKRVLEIRGPHVCLREPEQAILARYACLSHCWGRFGAGLQLNRATMTSLESGIEREQLPKTFRIAVDICSKLDIQLIWIDAICQLLLRTISSESHYIYGQASNKMIQKTGGKLPRPWQTHTQMPF
jgi:hypothetical protein